jgi:hypothetical protein
MDIFDPTRSVGSKILMIQLGGEGILQAKRRFPGKSTLAENQSPATPPALPLALAAGLV